VPYRAKSLYGGLPPAAALEHLRGRDWSQVPRPIDYAREVWPLVVRDAYAAYYCTLSEETPAAFLSGLAPVLTAIAAATPDSIDDDVAPYVEPAFRFDLTALADPAAGSYESPEEFDAFVAMYLADDLYEAEQGVHSALKAGLWSISVSRKFVIQLLTFGNADAVSHDVGLGSLLAFGGMVGSGPPAFRNRQLLALARAGLVHFVGPSMKVGVNGRQLRGVLAGRRRVHGSVTSARRRVDAQPRHGADARRPHHLPRTGGSGPSVHAARAGRFASRERLSGHRPGHEPTRTDGRHARRRPSHRHPGRRRARRRRDLADASYEPDDAAGHLARHGQRDRPPAAGAPVRRVLVTGAVGGMGTAIVADLARDREVVATARNADNGSRR
jgi:hypothetical protein